MQEEVVLLQLPLPLALLLFFGCGTVRSLAPGMKAMAVGICRGNAF